MVMSRSEAGKLGAIASREANERIAEAYKLTYALWPSRCARCECVLSYKKRHNRFCGHSCAARTINPTRATGKYLVWRCVVCSTLVGRRATYCKSCRAKLGSPLRKASSEAKSDGSRRRALLRERENRCACCGLDSWMSTPITLEVDHIDGNHKNNGQDNLRLLCPNCHSMTPTFKNKNRGNGRVYRMDRYREEKSKRLISSEVEQRTCNPPA